MRGMREWVVSRVHITTINNYWFTTQCKEKRREERENGKELGDADICLLYTSPVYICAGLYTNHLLDCPILALYYFVVV